MKKLQNYSTKNYFFIILFAIFIALIFFAPISSAVVANGVLSYDKFKKNIQHFEGGIVDKVLIKNGQEVIENQELLHLVSIKNGADRKIIQWKLLSLILQKQLYELENKKTDKINYNQINHKIKFLINNFSISEKNEFSYLLLASNQYLQSVINKYLSEIKIFNYKKNILRENIKSSKEKLKIINKQIIVYKSFVDDKILNENALFDLEKQSLELSSQILNYKNEIDIIDNQKFIFCEENSAKISQKIIETTFEIKVNLEQMKIANDVFQRSIIRSPVNGFVENLKVFSSGDIIESGKNILQIVPKNPDLIIIAKVKNIDIDNVKFNQNVEIFLKNFYEKNIPKISGTIFEISKDVIFDENLKDFYFEIKIKFDDNLKVINHQNLSAGMAVDIFIKQKNRNIFSYIFSPVFNSIIRSFKEFN